MTDRSSPESASAQIEKHLWDAIDLMAATMEKPDPRVWAMLDIYRPRDLAQRPAERTLTDEMVQAGAKALHPMAFELDEHGNYSMPTVARREARAHAREVLIAALSDTSTLGNSK